MIKSHNNSKRRRDAKIMKRIAGNPMKREILALAQIHEKAKTSEDNPK